MRFLRPTRRGGKIEYSPNDVTVARAVSTMRRAGLDEDAGFEIDHLLLYMNAMRSLVFDELELFSRVLGKIPKEKVLALAEPGMEGTNSLLFALRRRLFMDLVDEPEGARSHSASRE